MPVIKNILRKAKNSFQGLKNVDVFIEDTDPNSKYFNIFDLPEELPLGCSSFLIEGSELLKKEVNLKIELLDSQNNVVFTTPVDNYLEDKSRRVSIEVYEDVAAGVATLTILGELDPTKTSVPQGFRDVYNVRFNKRVNINKTKENDRPIRFYGPPTISVSEIVKGVIEETTGGTNQTSTVTGTIGLNVTTNKVLDSEVDIVLPTNNVDDLGEKEFISSQTPKSKKTTTFNSKIGKKGKKKKKQKKFKTTYSITGNVVAMGAGTNNSTNKITSDFVGATLTITNPHQLVDTEKFPTTRYSLPTTYSTTISEVVNETTFKVQTPYYVTDDTAKRIPVSLKSATNNASITYDSYVEETESTVFKRSYADITIGNLRTFSGDVYKAKIFTRDSNTPTDFEKIYDAFVEPPNILIDQTSATGFTNIGFFHQQSDINNNWVSSSIGGSVGALATQNNQYLVDGLLLSGSVEKLDSLVEFRTKNSFDLEKDVDYVVRFDSYFFKDTAEFKSDIDTISEEKRADLKVFLSGSGLTGNEGEEDYYLGKVEIPTNSNDEGEISNVVGSFRSAGSGSPKAWLKFKLNSGRFIIKDVSIEPFSEENFNPNYFRTIVPMPGLVNVKRNRLFDFRAEFYDVNNNEADVGATIERVNFGGVPTIIQGTDGNKLSGSLLVGESLEMYGTNPAYLRSVGYQGFAHTTANNKGGFMLFSGSIGSGAAGGNRITASEAYDGVGLEIVDAHDSDNHRFLKFRTNPSEFTVQTDQFFFGKDGQFISGSNGNIVISSSNFFLGGENTFVSGANDKLEISSSNFHLDNDGSVIMQGTITAEAGGKIGGFTIGSASMFSGADEVDTTFFLSGSGHTGTNFVKSNLVISSSGFQVNSTGVISASAGNISGFTITGGSGATGAADAIHSADKSLILSGSGQITGSNVLFTGGKIGSFNIGKTTNATPLGVLFSDSNELVITGSTGQITGSQVLFTGGKIGGFTIDADEIKSTNLLLDSNNEKITVGSANAVTIQGGSEDNFITMGKTTFGQSSTVGAILGMDDDKPTLELFKDANNQFIFNNSGIDIKSTTFDLNAGSGKLIIDSSTPSISLTDATAKLIVGNLDSVTDTSDGDKGIYAQGDGKLLIKEDASNYIQFNGGLDIKTETFKLDTDRLDIDSSTSRISVFDDAGSPKEVIRIGEVDGASNFGMKIFDGTGTADSDILVEFSETTNNIAGWVIGTSTIQGGNLVLNKEGTIESVDFSSGNIAGSGRGFRLTALDNGFLEVQNARIRGTLSTAVFEKETVNAVGGQLLIGNSTTITGSGGFTGVTASSATMSVENVTGFTGSYNGFNAAGAVSNIDLVDGEILILKKVDNTGFSTEYVCVNSASRNAPSDDNNLSGLLYVTRSFGLGTGTLGAGPGSNFTGSVGEGAKNYEDGQVVVSTGRYISGTGDNTTGTGYINLNARPTDGFTPYIDIVERTGSKVYEMDLKARLGDLSGISTAKVGSSPGFGLFTDRAFLTKDVTVGTLSGEHVLISGSYLAFKNNNTIMAQLEGTTWTLGGQTGTTEDAIKIAPGGVFIYDNSNDYVKVTSDGLNVYESGNNVATFGANSTITGGTITLRNATNNNDKVVISENSFEVFDNNNTVASFGANTILEGGTVTIRNTTNNNDKVVLSENKLEVFDNNNVVAEFGANTIIEGGTITLRNTTNNNDKVVLSQDKLQVFDNNTDVASFGAVTRIGDVAHEHISASQAGVTIKDGPKILANYSTTSKIFDGENNNSYVEVGNDGIIIVSGSITGSAFGPATSSFFGTGSNKHDRLEVVADGLNVYKDDSKVATFGAETFVGLQASEHIKITNSKLELKRGSEVFVSASSAGLYTSGSINASSGEIGGLTIDEDSIFTGTKDTAGFASNNGDLTVGTSGIHSKTFFVNTSDGTAGFAGTVTIGGTDLTTSNTLNTNTDLGDVGLSLADISGSISGSYLNTASASLSAASKSMATQVVLDSAGMSLKNGDASKTLATYGATSKIFDGENNNSFVEVGNGGIIFVSGSVTGSEFGHANGKFTASFFGAEDKEERVEITEAGLDIIQGDDVRAKFEANEITFGSTTSANEKSQVLIQNIGGKTGVRITDSDGVDIAFLGTAAAIASRTSAGSALPTTNAIRGIVTAGLTADQAIITGSFSADSGDIANITGDVLTITGSANVGGLVTSGSVRNTSTGAATAVMIHVADNSNTYFQVLNDGEVLARDNITAFTTGFTSISDKRLKTDIQPISESLDKIVRLKPTGFTWIEKQEKDIGFIAQEVEEVIPELIHETKGFIDIDSEEQDDTLYKSISYDKLTIYLVDAIKELTKRVEKLEKENKLLRVD
jgi:hypothetical protein